jgi:hypothetical protein
VEVRPPWVGWDPRTAVVVGKAAAVLIGDVSPPEEHDGVAGGNSELFPWIEPLRADGDEVMPAIAEVEDVEQLFTRLEARELLFALVEHVAGIPIRISAADPLAVLPPELVQVRLVPASERRIDPARQRAERVRWRCREHPAGPRPENEVASLDQLHGDLEPRR